MLGKDTLFGFPERAMCFAFSDDGGFLQLVPPRLDVVLEGVNQALHQNGGTLLEFIGDEAWFTSSPSDTYPPQKRRILQQKESISCLMK